MDNTHLRHARVNSEAGKAVQAKLRLAPHYDGIWKTTPMPESYTCHCGIAVHPSKRSPDAVHTNDCPYANGGNPMTFDDTHLNESSFGRHCPEGKVQLETVAAGNQRTNYGAGFMPTKHVSLELYVDGHRFVINAGTLPDGGRGVNIVTERELLHTREGGNFIDLQVRRT